MSETDQRGVDVLVQHRVDLDRRGVQAGLVRERGQAHVRLVGVRRDVGDLADLVRDPAHLRQALLGQDLAALLQLQAGHHAEQVGVARPLAVPVGGALHVRDAGVDRNQGVGHAAGGVVVAVDAQPGLRAAADGGDDVAEFVRHHAAVGVAQRDQVGAGPHGRADHFQGVVRVGSVTVEEVLGVEEDPLPVLAQVGDRVRDHREVLLQRGPQGEKDVPVVTLGDKGHDRRARFAQRGDLGVVGRLHAGPAGRAERGELRVLEVQFGDCPAEELGVLRDRAGPAALDEPDTELVQLPRDDELVGHAEVQALLLRAVAQGRVVDVKGVVEHRNVSWIGCGPHNKKTPREYARGLRADVRDFVPALGLVP